MKYIHASSIAFIVIAIELQPILDKISTDAAFSKIHIIFRDVQ